MHSNIFGFCWHDINILKASLFCGMSWHQICIGNLVFVIASTTIGNIYMFWWPDPLNWHNEYVGVRTGIWFLPINYNYWGFLGPHYPANAPMVCSPYLWSVQLAWYKLLVCFCLTYSWGVMLKYRQHTCLLPRLDGIGNFPNRFCSSPSLFL